MRRVNVYKTIADRALLIVLGIIADRCARLWNTAQYISANPPQAFRKSSQVYKALEHCPVHLETALACG
jgi:hypothetical protein